jgi:hypothetical protein
MVLFDMILCSNSIFCRLSYIVGSLQDKIKMLNVNIFVCIRISYIKVNFNFILYALLEDRWLAIFILVRTHVRGKCYKLLNYTML